MKREIMGANSAEAFLRRVSDQEYNEADGQMQHREEKYENKLRIRDGMYEIISETQKNMLARIKLARRKKVFDRGRIKAIEKSRARSKPQV